MRTKKMAFAAILTLAAILFNSFTAFAENIVNEEIYAGKITLGDVNIDGVIDATDARTALRASAGLQKLNAWEFLAADLNNNGEITASEARNVLRASAEISKLPLAKGNTTYKFPSKYLNLLGKSIIEVFSGAENLPEHKVGHGANRYLLKGYNSLYVYSQFSNDEQGKDRPTDITVIEGTINYLFEGRKALSLREIYAIFGSEMILTQCPDSLNMIAKMNYKNHVVAFFSDDKSDAENIDFYAFSIVYIM